MPASILAETKGRKTRVKFLPGDPARSGYVDGQLVTFESTVLGVVMRRADNQPTYLEAGREINFQVEPNGRTLKLKVDKLPPGPNPLDEPML